MCLPSENTITERKRLYQAKRSLEKAKMHLPSENVARKVEKAFTERMSLAKEKLCFFIWFIVNKIFP